MVTIADTQQREIPRAEQVGSLLRPERLLKALERHSTFSRDRDGVMDVGAATRRPDRGVLRQIEDECIREAVRRQIAAGLDVLSDGEFRRQFFMGSFYFALDGLATDSEETVEFHDDAESVQLSGRPYVSSRLKIGDNVALREVAFLKQVAGGRRFKVTFPAASSVASPQAFKPGITDQHYDDPMQMIAHMLQLERQLIDEAVEAGATMFRWTTRDTCCGSTSASGSVFAGAGLPPEAIIEGMLGADRAIVDGLPDHVHRALHICRGNYRGKWMVDGSLEPIAERVFNLPYDRFLVEWDDPARMGDYSALRHVPKGPVVTIGLISSKTPRLESEDEILRHIEQASKYLDLDQLAISPQCGFASEAAGNPLSEDDQWRKLELVVRVADRVWPR